MNLGTAQIIRANSRNLPLADDSVDLVVTSPPYFALRSYQDGGEHYAGQIGDEPTPAEFVDSLLEVTAECVRVLKPSGSLWVNLGDKYAGVHAGSGHLKGQESTRIARADRRDVKVDIPTKSLIGIPWRYALRCIDDLALILRAEVIWSKPNGLPESVTDRVRRSHEQWFHFVLNPRYFSAVDEIREAHAEGTAARYAAGYGKDTTSAGKGRLSGPDYSGVLTANPLGKLPGSVWTVPTEPLRVPDHLGVDHFAAFPTEWPKRIIAGWSPAGVCVECGEGRRPVSVGLGEGSVERRERLGAGVGAVVPGRETRATPVQSAMHKGAHASGSRGFSITGYACACGAFGCTPYCTGACSPACGPNTRPAVVLDPFGGTGTTAMVAKALGRHGISVDMSADYCRLAEWRVNDRDQLAKVLGVAKVEPVSADEQSLLDLLEGGAA